MLAVSILQFVQFARRSSYNRNNMKKVFSSVSVFVASVVGAGFATGKELIVFFGKSFAPLVFVGLIVAFSLLFLAILFLSISTNSFDAKTLSSNILGKLDFCYDVFLVAVSLVMTASMLAGGNDVLCMCFNISTPFFGIVTAFLVALLFCFKSQKIATILCKVTTVFIVFFTILLFTAKRQTFATSSIFSTMNSVGMYASFNVVCSIGAICNQAKDMTKKQAVISAVVSAVILASMSAMLLSILDESSLLIPTLQLVKHQPFLYWFGVVVVFLAIVSTLWANALPLVERVEKKVQNKSIAVLIVFGVGWLLSNVGFDNIVKVCYPAVSVLSVAISLTLICKLLTTKKPRKPSKGRWDAKGKNLN